MHINIKKNEGVVVDLKEALSEIERGCAEIIDFEAIEKVLKRYLETGETYYVKLGLDPTSADVHLGHSVVLRKMATFQKYGATIQLIIGDFTASIGDPTGKSETRKILSKEQIAENAKTYQEQIFKILDSKKTDLYFNSEWLDKLGADGLIALSREYNVARMLERDDFSKRFKSGTSISISEFLYPLLQGYDSVALKSDIELGGTDQKFNLLMGRHLQRNYNVGKEQSVLMMPLLEGLDGVQKMSKSLGNYIGVDETPKEMFAKVLSISDDLMWRYYELLSSKSLEEIAALQKGVESATLHPKKVKEDLALEIVETYHSKDEANIAKEAFDAQFKKKEIPDDIPEFSLEDGIWICKALVEVQIEPSTSQARRDIKQGAVKIDQEKISDEQLKLNNGEYILQVGKRKFAKVKVV
ncbi:MAG TPA: tyrosine--tRNA ligase [Nitratifractor sp.]|nr:tyrosine--tRNA ligase [Nitratifractor sp.]HHD74505.1 tyrosine--tRNA ligase [Nitratifractor sp.]HHH20909.1 tyrosine--tRNA ligase [Nitratifractor sp.]